MSDALSYSAPADELARLLTADELASRLQPWATWRDDARRFAAVAHEACNSPRDVLRRTAAEALLLCGAHSAGITVPVSSSRTAALHRAIIVGSWALHTSSTVSRHHSPDGFVVERNAPALFSRPARFFPCFDEWVPAAESMLLAPLRSRAEPVGVVWVVSHEPSRRFDEVDALRLSALARCASAAYDASLRLPDQPRAASGASLTRASGRALSRREQQVFLLVARGHTNGDIACQLGIGIKSVETYRSRVADKLGCRTRADFVSHAISLGIWR